MKLSELKNKTGKFDDIKFKNYRSIVDKSAIVDEIINTCLENIDGMLVVNYVKKMMALDMALVTMYTDLELDIEDSYDFLCKNGYVDDIKSILKSEYNIIVNLVDSAIQEKKEINNSISGVINHKLSNLIDKIPDTKEMNKIIKSLPKAINGINPDYLKVIVDTFKKEKFTNETK
jgi:hypothetical protein